MTLLRILVGVIEFLITILITATACKANALTLLGTRLILERDFPTAAVTEKGGQLQLYFKNTSSSAVTIQDFAIDGISYSHLPTTCNPYRCSQIQDIKWWQRWPNPVAPGEVMTLRTRLIDADMTLGQPGTSHTFTLVTSATAENYTISPMPSSLWFPYVYFSENLDRLDIYAANKGLQTFELLTSSVTINDQVQKSSLPQTTLLPGSMIPITIWLPQPLVKGKNIVIKLTTADGRETAFGSIRAFPSSFHTTEWSLFNDGSSSTDLENHSIETNFPGNIRFTDEPTGQLESPQHLADRVASTWNSPTNSPCGTPIPCMIQLTGYDEVHMYGDISDIHMTHDGSRNQDALTYLTWPKPVWYLPQNAWGRMEDSVWQFEYWYRPEDLWRQGFEGVGHGARNIQWFSHPNLWEQGYGRGGGTDYSRTKQDFYMPGTIANPVLWDRVGRISGLIQILKPFLTSSALMSSTVDSQGIEINTLVTSNPNTAVVVLSDKKTDSRFYTESFPIRQQFSFGNTVLTISIPAFLAATQAFMLDPFQGVVDLPFTRINDTHIQINLPSMQTAAAIVLGNKTDGDTLRQLYGTYQQKWKYFSDEPHQELIRPDLPIIPPQTVIPLSGGTNRLWSVDMSLDGTNILLTHGNHVYLLDHHGKSLWSKTYFKRMFYARFSVDNKRIYVAAQLAEDGEHSAILAYDLNGSEMWRYSVGKTILDLKPSLSDNGVFYTDWNNNVVRLQANGSLVWKYTTSLYPYEVYPDSEGGAITFDQTTIHTLSPNGTRKNSFPREETTPFAAAVASSPNLFAFSGSHINLYANGTLIKQVAAGRTVRQLLFSPDDRYLAGGSADGVFTLLTSSGDVLWQKREPHTYITDIQFLPDKTGVAFSREYFTYATSTMWQYRDTVEAYDWTGNLLWQHEGKWRSQPFMSQFVISAQGTLVLGTLDEVRIVDLKATPVSSKTIDANPYSLPFPWKSVDISPVAIKGKSRYSYLDNSYTLTTSGLRLGGNSDTIHYSYLPLHGDGEIVVKVAAVLKNDSYAGAGVMIREQIAPDAKNVAIEFLINQPNQHLSWRTVSGGPTEARWISPGTNNTIWLKLTRKGTTFSGAISKDNVSWIELGSIAIPMNPDVLIGLIAGSNNLEHISEALFTDLTFTGDVSLPPPEFNQADLNHDSFIDYIDMNFFIPLFGKSGNSADFNLNTIVDIFDFTSLFQAF